MKLDQYLEQFNPSDICTVGGNRVWDYKDVNDFTEIRLISEPVLNSVEYEGVTVQELRDFAGIFVKTAEVIDETTGESVKSI